MCGLMLACVFLWCTTATVSSSSVERKDPKDGPLRDSAGDCIAIICPGRRKATMATMATMVTLLATMGKKK